MSRPVHTIMEFYLLSVSEMALETMDI